jgi:hypothetical protein
LARALVDVPFRPRCKNPTYHYPGPPIPPTAAIGADAMRRRAKTSVPPLQQAEFDALPDSVRLVFYVSSRRFD